VSSSVAFSSLLFESQFVIPSSIPLPLKIPVPVRSIGPSAVHLPPSGGRQRTACRNSFPNWGPLNLIAEKTECQQRHIADPGVTSSTWPHAAKRFFSSRESIDPAVSIFCCIGTQTPINPLRRRRVFAEDRAGVAERIAGVRFFNLGCSRFS